MFSLLKFGMIRFLLPAIASKSIVVLKAMTTFAFLKFLTNPTINKNTIFT